MATPYEQKIIDAFKALCAEQPDGASPAEVTKRLRDRGEIAALDTVIDIADQMKTLRKRGEL